MSICSFPRFADFRGETAFLFLANTVKKTP
jgi:hypothetical protein